MIALHMVLKLLVLKCFLITIISGFETPVLHIINANSSHISNFSALLFKKFLTLPDCQIWESCPVTSIVLLFTEQIIFTEGGQKSADSD